MDGHMHMHVCLSLPFLFYVSAYLEEDHGHGGEEGEDRHHGVHVLGACSGSFWVREQGGTTKELAIIIALAKKNVPISLN